MSERLFAGRQTAVEIYNLEGQVSVHVNHLDTHGETVTSQHLTVPQDVWAWLREQ